MADFAAVVRRFMAERGMSLRGLAAAAHYDPGLLSKVLNGHRPYTPYLAARLDRALDAGGQIEAAGRERPAVPGRGGRYGGSRAVAAIEAVMAGDLDGPGVAVDSLGELIAHYAQVVSVAPRQGSAAGFPELLGWSALTGDLDEAATAGTTALECGPIVWPTLVLAGRLDRLLAGSSAPQADDFRARLADARQRLRAPAGNAVAGRLADE